MLDCHARVTYHIWYMSSSSLAGGLGGCFWLLAPTGSSSSSCLLPLSKGCGWWTVILCLPLLVAISSFRSGSNWSFSLRWSASFKPTTNLSLIISSCRPCSMFNVQPAGKGISQTNPPICHLLENAYWTLLFHNDIPFLYNVSIKLDFEHIIVASLLVS